MKFAPRKNMVMGRMAIRKSESAIILTDEAKVTKFILVDSVGPIAAAEGIKVGDLVIAKALGNIVMDSGTFFIPICEEQNIVFHVEEVDQSQLLVQTKNGRRFVTFESDEAAPNVSAEARALPTSEAA